MHDRSAFLFFLGGGEDCIVHVTAVGDHAQTTGIYSIFSSLYNILCKDVEQDTLSQASMYNMLRNHVEQNKLSQASPDTKVALETYHEELSGQRSSFHSQSLNTGIYSVFAFVQHTVHVVLSFCLKRLQQKKHTKPSKTTS